MANFQGKAKLFPPFRRRKAALKPHILSSLYNIDGENIIAYNMEKLTYPVICCFSWAGKYCG